MSKSSTSKTAEWQYMGFHTSFHYNFNLWFLFASLLALFALQLSFRYPSLIFFQGANVRLLFVTYMQNLLLMFRQSFLPSCFGLLGKLSSSYNPHYKSAKFIYHHVKIMSTCLFFYNIMFFYLALKMSHLLYFLT